MSFSIALPFSEGEEAMHELLSSPERDNPTAALLTPQAASMLQRAPLLPIGTLDALDRPWTTVWGGEPGFSQSLGHSIVGIRTAVDRRYDPVVEALVSGRDDGEVVKEEGAGKMMAALPIDLVTRKRVKVAGRMVAASLARVDYGEETSGIGQMQLVVKIEQSLGNCPKYLNKKHIRPAIPKPKLLSDSTQLSDRALALIAKSDLFFISSSNSSYDMDTNHRGGPPGFVRVLPDASSTTTLIYPEYSGNRLYQTLGNLKVTPRAGLCFPDFDTGDVLYMTGETEILVGADSAAVLPRSNVAVKITLTAARFVEQGLTFRGDPGEMSPYNPSVRLLAAEGSLGAGLNGDKSRGNTATLIQKTLLTPSIGRFRFMLDKPVRFSSSQWVALDFSEDLNIGYSHMRDDDPRSLNDDFIRTFTVSSPPPADGSESDEFEITIRRVGPVTSFLFRQNERAGLEVPVRGFGGEFNIAGPEDGSAMTPFVAGGVGITPLLGQLPSLNPSLIRLLWTLRADDVNLALDILNSHASLAPRASVFLTGGSSVMSTEQELVVVELKKLGVRVEMRRLSKADLDAVDCERWYICTGTALRESLLGWSKGKEVIFEDFNF